MIKATMLAALIAGAAMSANIASNGHSNHLSVKPLDTEIIVEVDRSLDSLTAVGIKNTQRIIRDRIKSYVTPHVKNICSFNVLNNAFAIAVNGDYVDQIKNLPGVKSVTINELHWARTPESDDGAVYIRGANDGTYDESQNVSALTMNKTTTNDGEGTVIAILDNEFYLRANHKDGDDTVESWHHETFDDLAASTVKRFDFKSSQTPGATAEEIAADKERFMTLVRDTHAYKYDSDYDVVEDKDAVIEETPLGDEGSLYFSSKVPFYFDYGGEKKIHSDYTSQDFDVSSEITYHGSHVASIAAGNAQNYKGIAPKAQLVLMKVFTNFEPNKIEQAVGLQASTGAYDIPILRALEDCVTLGVDGINMSLGSNLNDFDQDSITCKTLQSLAESGILTSISAGNSGKSAYAFTGGYGNWTFDSVETGILSGYTNVVDTMDVASGQPIRKFYENAFKMGASYVEFDDQIVNREGFADDYDVERHMYEVFQDEHGTPIDRDWVYIPGFGNTSDYSGLDVQDKIAVVNRGSISFSEKYKVAYSKGAVAMVVINNDPTASSFNFRMSFGDDQPEIPIALVLYSDIDKFGTPGGDGDTFSLVNKKVLDNLRAYTLSTFSSDGGTFDLQLKPEITAPGENIRGAVPPQKKKDREETPLSTYEYLSGTSMSAPNYAGAQSVLLSKVSKDIFKKANPTAEDLKLVSDFRETVNMRMMSTARIMSDYDYDPETYYKSGTSQTEEFRYTSPRIQGAGMVNLDAAYNTDVYLEGFAKDGTTGSKKSKIELRNSDLINNGSIKLSFIGHNESNETRTYKVKLTVMRPAVDHTTDIVTKEYNNLGDVDKIANFPGIKYYRAGWVYNPETGMNEFSNHIESMSQTGFAHNDVYKVTKEIKYWARAEDCELAHPDEDEDTWDETLGLTTIPVGRYYNAGDEHQANWLPLPDHAYQSVQDTLICEKEFASMITMPANSNDTYELETVNLTTAQKQEIDDYFEYGCYLEGYIELESQDGKYNLSMPWMGFYGGDNTYEDCPVVEEFSFEKNASKVYPSDLVNDLTKSLLGKTNVDFGSEWITTYIEQGKTFAFEGKILENDESLSHLCETNSNYHLVGTDLNGNRYANPKENIYVGNPHSSNTMIIQQFVLRSCADNYFTIDNENGETVYKDALQDMLFGDTLHKWTLYKSLVDDTYLGGGYVAHRAFAVIPLYDNKGEAFPSGNYTITFNYLLSATGTWVSKTYNMIIDSDAPTVKEVVEDGNNLRINITEGNLARLYVGSSNFTNRIAFDEETKEYYIQLTKTEAIELMNKNLNRDNQTGRLFLGMTDRAYGYTGAVIKFNNKDSDAVDHYGPQFVAKNRYIPLFDNYTIVEHHTFDYSVDIIDDGENIKYYVLDSKGAPTEMENAPGDVNVTRFPVPEPKPTPKPSSGCGGNIVTTSVTISALAGVLAISLFIAKKRKKGGQA